MHLGLWRYAMTRSLPASIRSSAVTKKAVTQTSTRLARRAATITAVVEKKEIVTKIEAVETAFPTIELPCHYKVHYINTVASVDRAVAHLRYIVPLFFNVSKVQTVTLFVLVRTRTTIFTGLTWSGASSLQRVLNGR